jgi:hypothetical protein
MERDVIGQRCQPQSAAACLVKGPDKKVESLSSVKLLIARDQQQPAYLRAHGTGH